MTYDYMSFLTLAVLNSALLYIQIFQVSKTANLTFLRGGCLIILASLRTLCVWAGWVAARWWQGWCAVMADERKVVF